ncbi:MAG: ABC transporter permease [Gammaproteobacteria bacterium]|nr:ABC transporter permease [Gammaproteobacteria bacterium]MDE0286793.1 ABC transporter permease [Gammaproteobacteria bacterium]MDE0513633.1 ABC transporter permease [Gammaproteobacteria bacterium]
MDYFSAAFGSALALIFSFDREVYAVVWTSLHISVVAVGLASLFGIPLGILVALREFPGKRLLQQVLNTLMALPTVVVGLLLYGLLTRQGVLGHLGLLYTIGAIIIGQTLLILPIIWNLSIAAASGADPRLLPTSKALGASTLQQGAMYVNEVRYALAAAMVAGFGRAIGEVGIAMMLGGNIEGFTRTMTTAIALETSKGEFEFALALGILLLATAFLVNFVVQRFQAMD